MDEQQVNTAPDNDQEQQQPETTTEPQVVDHIEFIEPEPGEPEPGKPEPDQVQTVPQTPTVTVVTAAIQKKDKKKIHKQKPPPVPPVKKRETKTVVFTLEEFEHIDKHFAARKQSGLSVDYNHFLRQCVDFCINNELTAKQTGGVVFAKLPIPPVYLKDAFFNTKNK